MTTARIVLGSAVFFAVTVGLAAATTAAQLPPAPMGPIGAQQRHLTQYGFFSGTLTPNNRVGIFVATRNSGLTKFYYCSTPIDPNANGPTGCKLIGLPEK